MILSSSFLCAITQTLSPDVPRKSSTDTNSSIAACGYNKAYRYCHNRRQLAFNVSQVNNRICKFVNTSSELTYYPLQEPGTWLVEPGYPDLVVLANVNSSSCSLFVIDGPSVVCLSVCRLFCNVGAPYSDDCNFRQYFYAMWYLGHP